MNKISKLILAGALVLGIGCGGEEAPAEPAAAAAAPAAAAPAAAAPAAAAPAAGGGGGVCERAAACCTGYIEAMVALSPAMAGSLNAETTACRATRTATTPPPPSPAACPLTCTSATSARTRCSPR